MRSAFRDNTITIFLAVVLILFVGIEALRAHLAYLIGIFDFDRYQVFEATHELLNHGVPRLPYLPNSSVALDTVYWSHHLLAYIYALPVKLFNLTYVELDLLTLVELPVILALIFVMLRKVIALRTCLLLLVLILLDPAFHFIFVEKLLYRWAYIFSLLAIIALFNANQKSQNYRQIWAFLAGFFTIASPLSFISLGFPVALTNTLFICIMGRKLLNADAWRKNIGPYFCGLLLLPLGLALYLKNVLPLEAPQQLFTAVFAYGKSVGAGGTSTALKESYLFIVSLLTGAEEGSLLPLTLIAVVFVWAQRKQISKTQQFPFYYGLLGAGVWIALALVVPTHFYAARLSWLLPILLVSVTIAIKYRHLNLKLFQRLVLLAVVLTVMGYAANYGAGSTRVGALLTIVLMLTALSIAVLPIAARKLIPGRWLLTITLLSSIPLLVPSLKNEFAVVRQHRQLHADGLAPNPSFYSLATAVREITANDLQGDRSVVTNMPAKEFFADGTHRQIVFFYRGLFSGARSVPADKLILFVPAGRQHVNGYDLADQNANIYYRGFCYALSAVHSLPANFTMLSGDPRPCEQLEDVQVTPYDVSDLDVRNYLKWRALHGLSIN